MNIQDKNIKKRVEESKASTIRGMMQDLLDDISATYEKRLDKLEKEILKIMRDKNDLNWVSDETKQK